MIERGVLGSADRVIQDSPRRFPLFKRFHLPLALVEARLIRTKSPLDVDPELVGEKETMMAELRNVRERTLAFLDETKERDLSRYRWKHPFLGTMNTYDWLRMIACHEIRHEKQMRKIASAYRNS
jgi:DinB superfamily